MNQEVATIQFKPTEGKLYQWKPEDRENEPEKVSKESAADPERGGWGNKLDFLFSCISVSVGLGNVWRFPYLCYKHGGGAFVITYMIAMIFGGIPLFYQEVALGQYLGSGGMNLVGSLCPILKGTGFATMTIVFFLDVYYCIIIAWTLFYLFSSFTELPDLPWEKCNHEWNTDRCRDEYMLKYMSVWKKHKDNITTPVEEFWEAFMAKHGLALQSFSNELINCLENLKTKREELQAIIDLEELEKAKLQAEIECLSNRLSAIMTSLTKKTAARADFDRAISESETALCRLLENSQAVVNNVRREMSTLSGDEIMKTAATCPTGSTQVCMIEPPGQLTCPKPMMPPCPPPCVPVVPAPMPPMAVAVSCKAANGL